MKRLPITCMTVLVVLLTACRPPEPKQDQPEQAQDSEAIPDAAPPVARNDPAPVPTMPTQNPSAPATTPDTTISNVFELVFDNTVADLPAGDYAYALVQVEYTEEGSGATSVYEFDAYGTRPADAPDGAIALFDTEFMTPDASYNGVMGRFTQGEGFELGKGSLDETYGSLADPFASTNSKATYRFTGVNPVATLTITNQTTAALELSTFNFDMGRWYGGTAITGFTLGVSGDVTENASLLWSNITDQTSQTYDFDDHDVDLTGLADHTLSAGESVTFTLYWHIRPGGSSSSRSVAFTPFMFKPTSTLVLVAGPIIANCFFRRRLI